MYKSWERLVQDHGVVGTSYEKKYVHVPEETQPGPTLFGRKVDGTIERKLRMKLFRDAASE